MGPARWRPAGRVRASGGRGRGLGLDRQRVEELVSLALSSGLSERDIAGLPAVRALLRGERRAARGKRRGPWPLPLLLLLLLPLSLLLLLSGAALRRSALGLWLGPGLGLGLGLALGPPPDTELCLVDLPPLRASLFRAPLDCERCRHVSAVHRRSNLSQEEFLRRYAYSMQPVVVEDGQRNWTAGGVFSFDFFTRIYGGGGGEREGEGEGRPAPGTRTGTSPDCQFFPYETDFHDLAEVFRMEAGRAGMEGDTEPWYIGWSNCNSSVANILRQHYKRPYFIPTISESSKMDWIFMGVPGHGAHMHIDDVDNPSWQAQIRGTKHWRLEPPAECYYECPLLETVVYPGQIIVLDTNKWFHETHILGEELSITIGSEYD